MLVAEEAVEIRVLRRCLLKAPQAAKSLDLLLLLEFLVGTGKSHTLNVQQRGCPA
jgi:hypothetical protein